MIAAKGVQGKTKGFHLLPKFQDFEAVAQRLVDRSLRNMNDNDERLEKAKEAKKAAGQKVTKEDGAPNRPRYLPEKAKEVLYEMFNAAFEAAESGKSDVYLEPYHVDRAMAAMGMHNQPEAQAQFRAELEDAVRNWDGEESFIHITQKLVRDYSDPLTSPAESNRANQSLEAVFEASKDRGVSVDPKGMKKIAHALSMTPAETKLMEDDIVDTLEQWVHAESYEHMAERLANAHAIEGSKVNMAAGALCNVFDDAYQDAASYKLTSDIYVNTDEVMRAVDALGLNPSQAEAFAADVAQTLDDWKMESLRAASVPEVGMRYSYYLANEDVTPYILPIAKEQNLPIWTVHINTGERLQAGLPVLSRQQAQELEITGAKVKISPERFTGLQSNVQVLNAFKTADYEKVDKDFLDRVEKIGLDSVSTMTAEEFKQFMEVENPNLSAELKRLEAEIPKELRPALSDITEEAQSVDIAQFKSDKAWLEVNEPKANVEPQTDEQAAEIAVLSAKVDTVKDEMKMLQARMAYRGLVLKTSSPTVRFQQAERNQAIRDNIVDHEPPRMMIIMRRDDIDKLMAEVVKDGKNEQMMWVSAHMTEPGCVTLDQELDCRRQYPGLMRQLDAKMGFPVTPYQTRSHIVRRMQDRSLDNKKESQFRKVAPKGRMLHRTVTPDHAMKVALSYHFPDTYRAQAPTQTPKTEVKQVQAPRAQAAPVQEKTAPVQAKAEPVKVPTPKAQSAPSPAQKQTKAQKVKPPEAKAPEVKAATPKAAEQKTAESKAQANPARTKTAKPKAKTAEAKETATNKPRATKSKARTAEPKTAAAPEAEKPKTAAPKTAELKAAEPAAAAPAVQEQPTAQTQQTAPPIAIVNPVLNPALIPTAQIVDLPQFKEKGMVLVAAEGNDMPWFPVRESELPPELKTRLDAMRTPAPVQEAPVQEQPVKETDAKGQAAPEQIYGEPTVLEAAAGETAATEQAQVEQQKEAQNRAMEEADQNQPVHEESLVDTLLATGAGVAAGMVLTAAEIAKIPQAPEIPQVAANGPSLNTMDQLTAQGFEKGMDDYRGMLTSLGNLSEIKFSNAVALFAQMPEATMIRDAGQWAELGYAPTQDAKPLVVRDLSPSQNDTRLVYDMSQVADKQGKLPEPLAKPNVNDLAKAMNLDVSEARYSKEGLLPYKVTDMVAEKMGFDPAAKNRTPGQEFLARSAAYAVCSHFNVNMQSGSFAKNCKAMFEPRAAAQFFGNNSMEQYLPKITAVAAHTIQSAEFNLATRSPERLRYTTPKMQKILEARIARPVQAQQQNRGMAKDTRQNQPTRNTPPQEKKKAAAMARD